MTRAKWKVWNEEMEKEEEKTRTAVMRKVIDKKVRAEQVIENWTSEILCILNRHFSMKFNGVCCYEASSYKHNEFMWLTGYFVVL
jgi:hypothetical protein